MRTRLAICAALALLATGCSSDDSGDGVVADATNAPESGGLPACADVWVDGETLPEDYDGCENPDGSIEEPVIYDCDSGIGRFTTYRDELHALLGGEITEAPSNSEEYAAAYEECFADA